MEIQNTLAEQVFARRTKIIIKPVTKLSKLFYSEFGLLPSLYGWQDPGEHPRVELEVVEGPEGGEGVEQGAAHHHDQVVDGHHLKSLGRECGLSSLITRRGRYLGKRFCKMFSESFTIVLQLLCCPGRQEELSGICLLNLLPRAVPSRVVIG